jgi:hypothetical protein
MTSAPDRSEAAPYYFTYIDRVPAGDICAILERQGTDMLALMRTISETQSQHRYAHDKWSIRELWSHINDTERLFVARAFWFARGFDTPLPSFDQHIAAAAARADDRSWASIVDEFRDVRAATLSFFRNLPEPAWLRRGIASDNPFTVRALAYMAAGHVIHHTEILRDRYGMNAGTLP